MIFFFSFSFFCLIFLTDKLNDERTTFPVKTLRLLQPRRASQPSIKTIDLLHTLDLSYILRLVLHNHFILFLFLRSLCAALTPPPRSSSSPPLLSPPPSHSLFLFLSVYIPFHSPRHAQRLQSCILKGSAVPLHKAVSFIKADAAAGPTRRASPRETAR